MVGVVMMGRIFFQRHDWLNDLALAALVILLIQPLYLWDAGFQLSFMSVIGIYIANQLTKEKSRIIQAIAVSLFASLFTFPIAAYYFYHVTPYAVLANLIVLPFSAILLASSFLTAIFGVLSIKLATFCAGSAYVILRVYEGICVFISNLPGAYPLTGSPSVETIFWIYCFCIAVFCFKPGKKNCVLIGICAAAVIVQLYGNRFIKKENEVMFLDVGQGDCALIQTYAGNCYLMDGGGIPWEDLGENVGEEKILPYLEYCGIDTLDGIFLSHMDADHVLGAMEVMQCLDVKALYLPDYPVKSGELEKELQVIVEKNEIPLYTVIEGDRGIANGDSEFLCLYPMENMYFSKGGSNAGSMVLKYSYGENSILFTGDLEEGQEKILMNQKRDLSCSVLKVAHHGAEGSSSEEFLKSTGADFAVISCGRNNHYGHPHKKTLYCLESTGIETFRTDLEGSILLRMSPSDDLEWIFWGERKPVYERIKEAVETGRIP